ncbi:MAG: hypothetical protein WC788_08685 [Candidatus Paceibacterota bacterium]|jgi:hypothetical protein
MDNLFLFAAVFFMTSVFHYLGFSAVEEFLFFERKYAKGLFFVFSAVLFFLAYLLVIEYSLWDKLMKFLI